MFKNLILKTIFILITTSVFSQSYDRSIAILNLSERNEESNNSRLISSTHILDVAGIPKIITSNLEEASLYSMILCSSLINQSTFTEYEESLLKDYVSSGGILIAPRVENERLFELFGINDFESNKFRYEIEWNLNSSSKALRWINEVEEETISLGRNGNEEIFKTIGYNTSSAETLAYFTDGTSAVIQNNHGLGQAISVGLSWKDIILRNEINRDYEAQRITSNGFEPTTDVIMLFVRGLYLEYIQYGVWKNTSPGNTKSTLMITHDVDSKTGMDSLSIFVDYERTKSLEATYNITLKYFEDAQSTSFYNNHQEELDYILDNGHQIQSHSVGHFDDFANSDIIPKGEPGNTKENYSPYNDGTVTIGATIFGECEVSKNELDKDFNINVRSFRAGHLAYPDDLIEVLEYLGYEYNSSYNACDVLTNFPYQNVIGKSFNNRLSSVYEIPVTISDVFGSDPINANNYLDKANIWTEVALKNLDNGAPTTLLIHPNRKFKLEALTHFLDQLEDEKIEFMELGKYGDFWKERKNFSYKTELLNNRLTIIIPKEQTLEENISLVINNGKNLSSIVLKNDNGEIINFDQEEWEENDIIVLIDNKTTSVLTEQVKSSDINIYPNPTQDLISLSIEKDIHKNTKIEILDVNGKTLFCRNITSEDVANGNLSLNFKSLNIESGTYFIVIKNESGGVTSKKIILL